MSKPEFIQALFVNDMNIFDICGIFCWHNCYINTLEIQIM